MMKFILKEMSLLSAFVVLGGLLLLSFWMTSSVNEVIETDFRQTQVTLVTASPEAAEPVRTFLENNESVVRYEAQLPQENKNRIVETYPELASVLDPLNLEFFPLSFLVTVVRKTEFLESLRPINAYLDRFVVHEAPQDIAYFLQMVTFLFLGLWLLTLFLVLYFNLERLTVQEEPKWSLMKMLGEKKYRLFLPLWRGQLIRVGLASVLAILVAFFASRQIREYFTWNWSHWEASVWASFLVVAFILTSALSYAMFASRYKKVMLG